MSANEPVSNPSAPDPGYVPLYELTRGGVVESTHFGAVAVVDTQGRLVAHHGDPQAVAFLRSTAKPFQALPFLEAGGASTFGLTPAHIALICASHLGTDAHVATLREIQAKTGVMEGDLMCGVHPPYHRPTAEALRERGEAPTPNRHNCSGKHTGMLAFARLKGWPLASYLEPDHPVQQHILEAFAAMCDLPPENVVVGTDGCSAPNFAVPLYNAARAYARLCDPRELPPDRAAACQAVTGAMRAHPEMVQGPGGFDTRLMQVCAGHLVAKGGAEGYYGLGIFPDARGSPWGALGVAIKVSDGDLKSRVRPGVVLEILRQLGVLEEQDQEQLADFGPVRPVLNWRKIQVGVARPCFELQ